MKKITLLFIAFLVFSGVSLYAQDQYQATWTKDGVKITGTNMYRMAIERGGERTYEYRWNSKYKNATLILENTTSKTVNVIIVFRYLSTSITKEKEYTLQPKEKRNALVPISHITEIKEIIVY